MEKKERHEIATLLAEQTKFSYEFCEERMLELKDDDLIREWIWGMLSQHVPKGRFGKAVYGE